MIILLSPAKTFSKNIVESKTRPIFNKESFFLINKLNKLSLRSIEIKMKLSKTLATTVYEYYQNFGKSTSSAIYTYDGYAFKGFDVYSLNQKELVYLEDHLYIMSGLYGLVRPFDAISYYRLEMQNKSVLNLYRYWKKKINDYLLENHPNTQIINLASNEYSQILDDTHQLLTISFLQKTKGQYKTISMHAKKARGMMARLLITNQISNIEEIKSIKFDGYSYDLSRSSEKEYVFIKGLTL